MDDARPVMVADLLIFIIFFLFIWRCFCFCQDYAFWNFPEGRSQEFYEILLAQARLLGNTTIVPFEEISSVDVSRIQEPNKSVLSPRNSVGTPGRHTRYQFPPPAEFELSNLIDVAIPSAQSQSANLRTRQRRRKNC